MDLSATNQPVGTYPRYVQITYTMNNNNKLYAKVDIHRVRPYG